MCFPRIARIGHARDVTDVVVRPPRRDEFRAARGVLVDALADDPAWAAVLPDESPRRTALRALVGFALADAAGAARVASSDGRVVGVAVWQPPGRYPPGRRRRLRGLPRLLPMAALGRRALDIQRLGTAIDAVFPATPVRYLQALGVAPETQGRGVGSRLLAEQLTRSDVAAEAVYLETGKPANVAWYEAQGFSLVAPGGPLYPDGPPMWRMCRPPRGTDLIPP
jgi:ribosomal protein S18 acetylase RimI-like enzyme